MSVVSHKKTQEKLAGTMAGGFLLVLSIAAFFVAAWMLFQAIATGEGGGDRGGRVGPAQDEGRTHNIGFAAMLADE